ncbi:MAG: GNAT family N-acetyltransferase [Gemmatimonadetes bacterium]|nr:GNAT family N-acetyltransferase [Gemmatimonadota bacterium]
MSRDGATARDGAAAEGPVETIRLARSDAEILRCFPVLWQLRTHLRESDFVDTIRRQQASGYLLAYLESDGSVRAVAGYRFIDNLYSGRLLYVDDLSTDQAVRSRGHGGRLFDWLGERAREEGCKTLELDSGVQRFDAHRFYLTRRMEIASHHFRLKL